MLRERLLAVCRVCTAAPSCGNLDTHVDVYEDAHAHGDVDEYEYEYVDEYEYVYEY